MKFRTFEELVAVTMTITTLMFKTVASEETKDMLVQYALDQIKMLGGVDEVIKGMKEAVAQFNERENAKYSVN